MLKHCWVFFLFISTSLSAQWIHKPVHILKAKFSSQRICADSIRDVLHRTGMDTLVKEFESLKKWAKENNDEQLCHIFL